MVAKKHTLEGAPQQFCLCIDYRKVNSLLPAVKPADGTKKGALALMPLPKTDELFVLLKGAKYFTIMDLQSGYCDITLDKESIPKSAFTTVFGKLEFLQLPFGLSQGPDFFIHLYGPFGVNKVTTQGKGCRYMAYLDDILIYSRTEKENLEMLDNIFKQLFTAGLKIKLSKCSFFKEQIHYLGQLVSTTSILPLVEKIEALMKSKPPTNV